ncbi:MAG: hypothetical protein ACRDTI_03200 [Mycobacterium sp.]
MSGYALDLVQLNAAAPLAISAGVSQAFEFMTQRRFQRGGP